MRRDFHTTLEIGRHFGIDTSTVLDYLKAPRPVAEVAASVPVSDNAETLPSAVGGRERLNAGGDLDARAVPAPARPDSPGVTPT